MSKNVSMADSLAFIWSTAVQHSAFFNDERSCKIQCFCVGEDFPMNDLEASEHAEKSFF